MGEEMSERKHRMNIKRGEGKGEKGRDRLKRQFDLCNSGHESNYFVNKTAVQGCSSFFFPLPLMEKERRVIREEEVAQLVRPHPFFLSLSLSPSLFHFISVYLVTDKKLSWGSSLRSISHDLTLTSVYVCTHIAMWK